MTQLALLLGMPFGVSIGCGQHSGESHADVSNDVLADTETGSEGPDVRGDADTGAEESLDTDVDPYCHYDCFGFTECNDGVVTTWEHAPVPCDYWEGVCPHYTAATCERGCRSDGEELGAYDDPSSACEENRPKRAGDPCVDESWCLPQVPTVDDDGTVRNVYLRCDLDTHVCVEADPPVVEDLLAYCGLSDADLREPPSPGHYGWGFASSDVCSGGLCLIMQSEECLLQGCTIACAADHECPPGTVCQTGFRDWSETPGDPVPGVCKPGTWNAVGVGLQCGP